MSYNVKIKKNAEGVTVNAYANNAEFGYLTLEETAFAFEGGWLRPRTRTALLRGKLEELNAMIQHVAVANALPGKIVVSEFLESDLPASYESKLDKTLPTRDAQLDQYFKRAGKGGPCLTLGGERILRFSEYSFEGVGVDTTVAHDNVDAVADYRKAQALAELPAGKK